MASQPESQHGGRPLSRNFGDYPGGSKRAYGRSVSYSSLDPAEPGVDGSSQAPTLSGPVRQVSSCNKAPPPGCCGGHFGHVRKVLVIGAGVAGLQASGGPGPG